MLDAQPSCSELVEEWRLLLWPTADRQLGRFVQRLTVTHVRRWHAHRHSDGDAGGGHLYEGAYKSFPVQDAPHFLTVARYVERNALRAGLVQRAQDCRWCSLWRREQGTPAGRAILGEWPVDRPAVWLTWVNAPHTPADEIAIRTSVHRGRPYGDPTWQQTAATTLRLHAIFRDRGRPPKAAAGK